MKKLIFLTTTDEVKEGVSLPLHIANQYFIAGRRGERFWAVDGNCPHSKASMRKLPIVAETCIICPYHGAQFDPFTGKFLAGPAGTADIKTYPVLMDDGSLFLETEADPMKFIPKS